MRDAGSTREKSVLLHVERCALRDPRQGQWFIVLLFDFLVVVLAVVVLAVVVLAVIILVVVVVVVIIIC